MSYFKSKSKIYVPNCLYLLNLWEIELTSKVNKNKTHITKVTIIKCILTFLITKSNITEYLSKIYYDKKIVQSV